MRNEIRERVAAEYETAHKPRVRTVDNTEHARRERERYAARRAEKLVAEWERWRHQRSKLPPDERGPMLHPGERVVLDVLPSRWWTLAKYIFTLGLWEIWRRRHHFLLTNQRVVLTKGIISKSEESAPLSRIQDARLQRSPLTGGKVDLTTAGTGQDLAVNEIGPLTRADALAFADALTPLIGTERQDL